ncbi:Hypothetical protein, putative [Bodo saltans]|uniref:Uncharacterized protein n=1 Tax=Bodo saltans TaxID=75058 RepID=A0A0S4JJW0_BODSA|nr:Hypothetical protein, putative [Bodo saltans]|eukprot:CUG89483.1 Hypothetical protein, putative [Bodo saltans]
MRRIGAACSGTRQAHRCITVKILPELARLKPPKKTHQQQQQPTHPMHIQRPVTTVEKFERLEYHQHRFKKHTQAVIDGIAKSVPVTPSNLVSTLLTLCGADDGAKVKTSCAFSPHTDPFSGWSMTRVMRYSAGGAMLSPSFMPIFHIFNPLMEQAAIFHVPPLLPLPPLSSDGGTLSVRDYLNFIGPHIHRCTPSFVVPTTVVDDMHDAESSRRGVGVVIATRSEFTTFTAETFHDRYRFVDDTAPFQVISDDVILPDGTPRDERLRVLQTSIDKFANHVVKDSTPFHKACTWWYRVDADVVDMLREALSAAAACGSCAPAVEASKSAFLTDDRWTMLPRTKLLKNVRWNVEPETMAEEMKYGLIEAMKGASPAILKTFEVKRK